MSNVLFCVTGPSGSGKTTIFRELMDNELLSFTTRPMRDGEVNGQDYLFITKELFDELFASGALAEWTEYDGYYYGLTMDELEDKLDNDHAFFVCDNNGFNQIKEKYNNVVSVFLYAEEDDCADNMFSRGDPLERVGGRLSTYEAEISNRGQYDYVIKNTRGYKLETLDIVEKIVQVEQHKNYMNRDVEL